MRGGIKALLSNHGEWRRVDLGGAVVPRGSRGDNVNVTCPAMVIREAPLQIREEKHSLAKEFKEVIYHNVLSLHQTKSKF